MADNTVLNPGALGDIIATEDIGGIKYELIKLMFGGNGVATKVDAANPLPVTDAVSEGALLSIAAEDFATEATLAALLAKVIAAPSTEAKQDAIITLLTTIAAITQPLTDAQLRASAVPVTISGGGGAVSIADGSDVTEGAIADAIVAPGAAGTLSAKLRRISQGLEDLKTLITVLPLPTGAATAANQQTNALTDTQLRATPVPVSGTIAVTGAGDATAANQATQITAEQAIQAAVQIMDDWDESDRAKVNLIVGQAGIAAGTGVDGVTVPRVTLATNVALPAGNNNIGDVDIASIAAGANLIGKVGIDQTTPGTTNAVVATGNVAHDAVDSGNPVKVGLKAIAYGTNPTSVAAADRTDWYANVAGVPFMIGGHPNIVCLRATYTAAQTDTAIVTISSGLKIVVTRLTVTASSANTVNPSVIIGFGATTTPTTTGVVLSHPAIAPGSGVVEGNGAGTLGVGADGEDLRITSSVPTTGAIDVVVSYFTIES